jgi:hypothetical protein
MADFVKNETERFAKIVHFGVGEFEILSTLQERFVKDLNAYHDTQSKREFLKHLDSKIDELFSKHVSKCTDKNCPTNRTYDNIKFLISSETNNLMPKGNVSSFLENNESFFRSLENFKKKIDTTSAFLEKEEFINQEIVRVRTKFIDKKINIIATTGTILAQFDFSQYIKFAYEWLMAGHDWSIEQIVKNAKRDYDQTRMTGINDQVFSDAIIDNLKEGVGFVLYEKFLKDQLKEINQSKKVNIPPKANSNRKKRVPIPNKIKALLQKEIQSICPFCPSEDVDHFEIHHIDENPENNSFENLLMLCPLCHSKITKGDILIEAVIIKKTSIQKKR